MEDTLKLIFTFLIFHTYVYAQEFEILSTPSDVEVFIKKAPKDTPQKLGKTPLKLKANEVFSKIGEQKTFLIKLEKEGFKSYEVVLVKSENVDMKLDFLLEINPKYKIINKHDLLISDLFKVQRLIRSNNLSEAITKLEGLEKENKDFSVITELKGIAYYMQKDLNKALSMFRLAFSKNPDNQDAYKMKVYIEKKLGLDSEI